MRRKQNQENNEKENKKRVKPKKVTTTKKETKKIHKPNRGKKVKIKKITKKTKGGYSKWSFKKLIRLLIFVLILVILYYIIRNRHILGITFSRKSNENDTLIIETNTAENTILNYQRELLVCSKGNLTTYSGYGEKTWEYDLEEVFIPEVNVSGKYIQVVNKDTGNFYIFSGKYEKARKRIEGNIKTAAINKRGDSAIHYSTSGLKSVVGIYNSNGNLEYKVTLTNSNIIDIDLSNNSRYMAIYEIGNAGVGVSTSIKLVDFNKKNNIIEIAKIDSDIVYDMFFCGNNLVLVCSEGIYKYNLITKETTIIDITDKNISYISADDTGYAFVYKDISKDYSVIKL